MGKYEYIVDGVEDLDGTSSYRITSTAPLPSWLIEDLNRNYVGISRLEFLSLRLGFEVKAIELEENDFP